LSQAAAKIIKKSRVYAFGKKRGNNISGIRKNKRIKSTGIVSKFSSKRASFKATIFVGSMEY